MARRQKKKQEVSLFPFLDILACVIGNLILIITAVVLESVDSDKLADVFENEAIQKQTEAKSTRPFVGLRKSLNKLEQDSISSDSSRPKGSAAISRS